MARRAIPVASLVLAALGCGPNYRYAYDGEAAFERCYALDFNSAVTPGDRASCWTAWLNAYSYGASPDRLDYARNRLTASNGPGAATLDPTQPPPAPPGAAAPPPAPGAPIVANTAPAPAATTPAPTLDAGLPLTPPPATTPAPTASGEPPGASCANECRSGWTSCGGRCAQRDAACEARCDDVYRDCMRGCY